MKETKSCKKARSRSIAEVGFFNNHKNQQFPHAPHMDKKGRRGAVPQVLDYNLVPPVDSNKKIVETVDGGYQH